MGPCAAGRAWAWRAWEEGRQRTFRRGTALHQLQRERQRERVHERRPPQHAALRRGVERSASFLIIQKQIKSETFDEEI
jgi:hypothetical protein